MNEVAVKPSNTISGMLTAYKDQIALALPKHMDVDRMVRIAMTVVRKTPKLQQCTPVSLLGAVIQAAQLGLEPGIQAHLVPFFNGKTGQQEVQMIPDYRGLIALARRSGEITSFSAHAVYENDFFDYEYGTNQHLKHKPTQKTARGSMIGAYAIAEFKAGPAQFEYMTKTDIDLIRTRSKSGKSGPWSTDYDEMAKKTVVRRLCKYLPVSIELAHAVALDGKAEAGESQDLGFIIDGEFETEPTAQTATQTAQENLKVKVAKAKG